MVPCPICSAHLAHVDEAARLHLRALALAQLLAVNQDGARAVHVLRVGEGTGRQGGQEHTIGRSEVGGEVG